MMRLPHQTAGIARTGIAPSTRANVFPFQFTLLVPLDSGQNGDSQLPTECELLQSLCWSKCEKKHPSKDDATKLGNKELREDCIHFCKKDVERRLCKRRGAGGLVIV